jgi:hypothetical protein
MPLQSEDMNAEFVGGILLIALGLRTRTPARLPGVLLGSYLVYRGVSAIKEGKRQRWADDELIDEASMESFPASDPPAWTTAALI